MSKLLASIGLFGTVFYGVAVFLLTQGRYEDLHLLPLNELGDFLAGIFGPLAIFWLILGFFQQGQELRQSTKALELQAEELNNSVQQQRELVEVTRNQVEAELEALHYERNRQFAAAQPNLVFHGVGSAPGSAERTRKYTSRVKNTGGTINHVTLACTPKLRRISPPLIHSWETNREFAIEWEYEENVPYEAAKLVFSFTDSLGNQEKKSFMLRGISLDGDRHSVNVEEANK